VPEQPTQERPLAVATPEQQSAIARGPINSPATQAALQAVVQRSMQKADQAAAMAERGMLYSARSELVQAVQLIAQALDAQQATTRHTSALASGLTAIEEARDFATQPNGPSEDFEVRAIAAGHRTKALTSDNAAPVSPVAAQQNYLALAQGCFIEAAGSVPAASQILYRLGRLETAMAAHDTDPLALHGPQAIVFHQAALATDGGNWLAANELGVLYARYGQLDAAKQLLLASITAHPHVAGWQNLAAIHRRLGETDLAKRADAERELLASKPGAATTDASAMVRWVDPKTFAATGGNDVKWPAEVASKPKKQ
jgi:tetratricopeptide (TPR) repeat protein